MIHGWCDVIHEDYLVVRPIYSRAIYAACLLRTSLARSIIVTITAAAFSLLPMLLLMLMPRRPLWSRSSLYFPIIPHSTLALYQSPERLAPVSCMLSRLLGNTGDDYDDDHDDRLS